MTALYAALILIGPKPQQALTSQEIIAKTLVKYANAKSGVGEFVMSQSTQGKKVAIKTELQIERPSKIYLHQSSDTIAPLDWLLVSDGANFGYDVPGNPAGPRRRLFEPVAITESATGAKKLLKVHSLYMAAKRSLGDNLNPFVEFITQSEGDGQSVKGFLTRLYKINAVQDKTLPDGATVYSIGGNMMFGNAILDEQGKQKYDDKGNPMFESAGRFELTVSKDFDLVGMKTSETITLNDAATNLPTQVVVVTSWTGKFQIDATPADVFKVK